MQGLSFPHLGELCPVLHPSPLNSQQLLNSASSSQRGPCPGSGPRHCPTACSRAFTQTPRRAERGHKFKGGTQGSPQPKAHEKTGGHRAEGQPVARGVFTTPKRKRDTKARGTQCREESLRSQKETRLKDLGLEPCRDGSAFQKQNILASLLSLSPLFSVSSCCSFRPRIPNAVGVSPCPCTGSSRPRHPVLASAPAPPRFKATVSTGMLSHLFLALSQMLRTVPGT